MDWGIFWASQLALFIFIPLLVIWLFAIVDLFARGDIGGLGKSFWLLAILFLPIFGTVGYYLFLPAQVPRSPGSGSSSEATPAGWDAGRVVRTGEYEMQRAIPGMSLARADPQSQLLAVAYL